MILQDLQVNQAVQGRINDRFRLGGEPFDPVLGIPLDWFGCNFLQYWVESGVARFCLVQKEQGYLIRVNTSYE